MRTSLLALAATAVLMTALPAVRAADAPARVEKKPNILFILADDLGYGDLGVTYQNQHAAAGKPSFVTPHLDALAASGTVLHSHYTGAPVCAPARASLLLGMSQGHAPVRDNQFDKPIPEGCMTLGDVLRQAGYRTAAIGKWGLGGKAKTQYPAHPMRRGFDEYFGFMEHAFGHVYYHDAQHPLMDGTTDVGAKYENVYSTDLFTARAKQFIVTQHQQHPDQPFFLYLAYTAVHNALNVPGGPYPKGGGIHGGLQWPLQPTPETRNTWIHPDYASKGGWTDHMKRYATMARRLDDGVNDVLQTLKDLHLDDDTLVVFTSDNGPANEGGADPRLFDSWGPFDGFKRDCFEGGVREPAIVAWPGHVPAGRTAETVTAFWDWMPTFAELTHLPVPAQADGVSLLPVLLKKDAALPADRYAYVEYFNNSRNAASADVFARKHVTGRGQQQLVRIGDYVGVRTQIKSPSDPLRLYDVAKDPHEDHDLAGDGSHKELLSRMNELLVTARVPDASAERPYDGVPFPADDVRGLNPGHLTLIRIPGDAPWTPNPSSLSAAADQTREVDAIAAPKDAEPASYAYEGYLTVPADGTYTFTATADAGVHLWLHDAHVISSESATPDKPLTASVPLKAGVHPFRLAYRHHAGTPVLSLHWSGPNLADQAIPASALGSK